VLQAGGRHCVRTSSLAAVLLPEEPLYLALLHDEGRWKGGGEAVTGVEFRITVKPSVKTIQLVGQVKLGSSSGTAVLFLLNDTKNLDSM